MSGGWLGRVPRGVVPQSPGPGQESVWNYPRPPLLQRRDCLVEVWLGGVLVCRADHALLIKETSHPPTYYLPLASWAAGALEAAPGSSVCEWKGVAEYLDVVARDDEGRELARAAAAAWRYPSPQRPFEALAQYASVYPGRMQAVSVNGESVRPQEGGFYGGWITDDVVGPFKGQPDSWGW